MRILTKILKDTLLSRECIVFCAVMMTAVFFSGCDSEPVADRAEEGATTQTAEYHVITAEQAKDMMDGEQEYILLDVRTDEEWTENRIDGSILIPDTEIRDRAPDELSDKDALILLYCRTGRRSAGAANVLIELGYTNVYDFGGIVDWPYETVSGSQMGDTESPEPLPSVSVPEALTVSFDYERQTGYASNQFAVWIEDKDGNLVKTLYATRYTANGGYKDRPDSIPVWVEKSQLAEMPEVEVELNRSIPIYSIGKLCCFKNESLSQ